MGSLPEQPERDGTPVDHAPQLVRLGRRERREVRFLQVPLAAGQDHEPGQLDVAGALDIDDLVPGHAEAEDVTQEVFLRLWNQPDRFDPTRGTLRSFLLAQAHARAVDAIRSLNSRRAREAKDARRTASAEYDMQHEVWDLSLAEKVSEALGTLPTEERRAIELAYFEGRTYVEVAELLDQPEGTVKSRIRNGMRRMRSVLVEAGIQGVDA